MASLARPLGSALPFSLCQRSRLSPARRRCRFALHPDSRPSDPRLAQWISVVVGQLAVCPGGAVRMCRRAGRVGDAGRPCFHCAEYRWQPEQGPASADSFAATSLDQRTASSGSTRAETQPARRRRLVNSRRTVAGQQDRDRQAASLFAIAID
ncbi:hypothetical protein D3C71_1569720 [compost metagenome]